LQAFADAGQGSVDQHVPESQGEYSNGMPADASSFVTADPATVLTASLVAC
jgi:hypothetical protein